MSWHDIRFFYINLYGAELQISDYRPKKLES